MRTLDAWDEKEMRWASLPGCTDEGPNLNTARKLAEFWIPRGGSGGPLTVRSEALADFIRADTNGLVSFLIVRETGETDSNGLAHAFASKEHPTARPPTLRLEMNFSTMKTTAAPDSLCLDFHRRVGAAEARCQTRGDEIL